MDGKVTLIILIGIIAIVIALCNFIDIIHKRRKTKKFAEGLQYRRVHGLFNPDIYKTSQMAKKHVSFLRQRNTGPNPETFNKNIQSIDYCDDRSRLVIKGKVSK